MVKAFFGNYPRSLDPKGRLLLPSALIGESELDSLYILKGFDGCISVYLPDEFEELLTKLKTLNQRDPSDRVYLRMTTSSMKELKVDSHKRILLGADTLREYNIGNEVTVLGVLDHIEIWDRDAYNAYLLHNGAGYDNPVWRS